MGALNAILLRKKLDAAKEALSVLRDADGGFDKREKELLEAIDEAETSEQKEAVEAAVAEFEADKQKHEEAVNEAEAAVDDLTVQLAAEEENQRAAARTAVERKVTPVTAETREFFGMGIQERDALFARPDVKAFADGCRSIISKGGVRAIENVALVIPTVMLDVIRQEISRQSKLIPYVRLRRIYGDGRQLVVGDVPEAVWTEKCASINEIQLALYEVLTSPNKLGAFIPVCNSAIKLADVDLVGEVISAIAASIAKAKDNAILWGDGVTMPTGIVTRLAQTSQPADWGAHAPAWTDLHTSHMISLNIGSETGAAFFSPLITALAAAIPVLNGDGLVWIMNRSTHAAIMAKALAYTAGGAIVAGTTNSMPIIGGTIIEMEDSRLSSNVIIGGYFGHYLWAESSGVAIGQSEHAMFVQDHTVVRGTQLADGLPLYGEAFVCVNIANGSASTTHTFPTDYANAEMNLLTVTAAAGSATGKTVLTVSATVAQSAAVLKYKVRGNVEAINVGDTVGTGWSALTSGTTAITAAAGTIIGVVELDGNNRVVSVGSVASVPKTS